MNKYLIRSILISAIATYFFLDIVSRHMGGMGIISNIIFQWQHNIIGFAELGIPVAMFCITFVFIWYIISFTEYFATFELESNEKIQFKLTLSQYGMFREDDKGTLSYKCIIYPKGIILDRSREEYISFERDNGNRINKT